MEQIISRNYCPAIFYFFLKVECHFSVMQRQLKNIAVMKKGEKHGTESHGDLDSQFLQIVTGMFA